MFSRHLPPSLPHITPGPSDRLRQFAPMDRNETSLDHEVHEKIRLAVEKLHDSGAPILTAAELRSIGLPERHHGAFVYFALAKKYPELVPNMMADSIGRGLDKLASVSDPKVQSKLATFFEEFDEKGTTSRFSRARLDGVEIDASGKTKIRFTLPPKPKDDDGARIFDPSGRIELSTANTSPAETRRWRATIDGPGHTWRGTLRSSRSLEDLNTGDLESLRRLLAHYVPSEAAETSMKNVAKSNPETAALSEVYAQVSQLLATKLEPASEVLEHVLQGSGVGEITDKALLARVAGRLLARTETEGLKRD